MSVARQNPRVDDEQKEVIQEPVTFTVEIFESRFWKNRYLECDDQVDEIKVFVLYIRIAHSHWIALFRQIIKIKCLWLRLCGLKAIH